MGRLPCLRCVVHGAAFGGTEASAPLQVSSTSLSQDIAFPNSPSASSNYTVATDARPVCVSGWQTLVKDGAHEDGCQAGREIFSVGPSLMLAGAIHGTQRLGHTNENISPLHFSLTRRSSHTRSCTSKMLSVSVEAVIKACLLPLISLIYHGAKAPQTPPKPTQAQPKFWMPSFRSPHTLPTEIILKFAEFLDEASSLALRHRNRDLFYTISLTPDQYSRLPESKYLAALHRLTVGNDKNHQGFCTTYGEHRPLTFFSVSEVMALNRLQPASCLKHS
jgi:hypothetical protein